MSYKYRPSNQWKQINDRFIGDPEGINLGSFRRNGEARKITVWDYNTDGARYYKTLLFNEALRLTDRQWGFLDKIQNRHVGNPITVTISGRSICFDYLLSIYEIDFLEDSLCLIRSAVEIGAGFGRTCHSILSNFPNIKSYTIVDLPNCLELSRRYLKVVLPPERFAAISFVSNEASDAISQPFDLAINVDSMMEMIPEVVDNYLSWIDNRCSRLYTKNPVGKYHHSDLEETVCDTKLLEMALSTGKLQHPIKMFDRDDLDSHVPAFLEAFTPGPMWKAVKHSWALPFTYFHQVIYCRK